MTAMCRFCYRHMHSDGVRSAYFSMATGSVRSECQSRVHQMPTAPSCHLPNSPLDIFTGSSEAKLDPSLQQTRSIRSVNHATYSPSAFQKTYIGTRRERKESQSRIHLNRGPSRDTVSIKLNWTLHQGQTA